MKKFLEAEKHKVAEHYSPEKAAASMGRIVAALRGKEEIEDCLYIVLTLQVIYARSSELESSRFMDNVPLEEVFGDDLP